MSFKRIKNIIEKYLNEEKYTPHLKYWVDLNKKELIDSGKEHTVFMVHNPNIFNINPEDLLGKKTVSRLLAGKDPSWRGGALNPLFEKGFVRVYYNKREKELYVEALNMKQAHGAVKLFMDKLTFPIESVLFDLVEGDSSYDRHFRILRDYAGVDQVEVFYRTGRVKRL